MTDTAADQDVVDLLLAQHQQIRSLFARLETAAEDQRTDLFRELVTLLAVHETAEEEVVHPRTRRVEGGDAIVDARLGEEHRAKELLGTLNDMGPKAEGFDTLLLQLRDDVLAHARHEEQEEFPRLRRDSNPDELRGMAVAVRAAEALAPTRPHAGVESATANLLLGPPLAIMDRARDLIRSALGR
jgi:hemerythrin superfamily protein